MPRRREVPKREILPDPKHKSEEVAKFMNVLMTRGKKSVAERILYGALDTIAKKSGKDAFEVFNAAINNVKPMVEVKSRRVGGANYQVPGGSAPGAAARRCRCAGSARPPASAARRAWRSAWPTS
jgi:small subunit ribosomal protein S7